MKCPERPIIVHQNIREITSNNNAATGEYQILIETKQFCDCYKEKCMAWDKKKKTCRKITT